MMITMFNSAFETPDRAERAELTGSEFLDHIVDPESVPAVECRSNDEKLNSPGFACVRYLDGATTKHAKNVHPDSVTEVFVYDVDEMTLDEIEEAFPLWCGVSGALYSTYKHTPEKPRYRVLVELDEAVSNYAKEPFHSTYLAVADALKIKADPKALDRVRLSFGPQHQPGIECERMRFTGPPVQIKKLAPKITERAKPGGLGQAATFDVTLDRPSRQEIKKLATSWRRSRNERKSKLGTALEAALRGDAYAPKGSVHNTSINLAFELVREFPRLDGDWFGGEYLAQSWAVMGVEGGDKWSTSIESARSKLEESEREDRDNAARVSASGNGDHELTEGQLASVEALRGRLVVSYRRSYYVYSARCETYKGPFASAEVAVAVRDLLAGVPGVTELEWRKSGPILKSAVTLCHEYGCTAENVIYYARKPAAPWSDEAEAVCLQAYQWIRWEPVYHEIADDLLRSISGDHYDQLEAYLSKFRDLRQPLPALTMVGPRGTWKSRICEILSRCWTSADAVNACDAERVMNRFNGGLLKNPVVWSDEALAVSWQGKPKPEAYRQSITANSHAIEGKGQETVTLMSAVRHMISVNDDAKVFSSEVDADSIHATMERFLLLYTHDRTMADFEDRWAGTDELARLRSGESLLEHVRWIERERQHKSQGRLFVTPHTDAEVLMRARFSDDVLYYIFAICLEAAKHEERSSRHDSACKRLPLFVDGGGVYRFSPVRVQDLWGPSQATAGCGIKKPTAQRIGRLMVRAGFKVDKDEKASTSKYGGWEIDVNLVKRFLEVSDLVDWDLFALILNKNRPKKK
jgi:hypothetical protein